MQLYLRPFYNILRRQNNFEWTTEHQTRFDEIKNLLTEQISNTIPDPNQPFFAMCDASSFGIGASLLHSHSGTNKMNLISANFCLFLTLNGLIHYLLTYQQIFPVKPLAQFLYTKIILRYIHSQLMQHL